MKKIITLACMGILLNFASATAQTAPSKTKQTKSKTSVGNQKSTPEGPAQTAPAKGKTVAGKPESASLEPSEMDMKQWFHYMTPGPMHEMLAKSNGEWKQEITMWMKPGDAPTKSESMCTNSMIMGNRYQESKTISTFNGMPFEGTNILGYDNLKKVFISTWIDNMGTGIMYMEGTWDEAKSTIHFKGKSVDPMAGKEVPVREEFKMIDDHNQLMEMFTTVDGKERKSMEIKFSR